MDNVMMLEDSALAMQIDGDPTVRMPVYASMENVTKRLESALVNKIGGALSVRMPVIVVPTHNVTKQQEGAFVSQDGGLGAVTTNALVTTPHVINWLDAVCVGNGYGAQDVREYASVSKANAIKWMELAHVSLDIGVNFVASLVLLDFMDRAVGGGKQIKL